MQNRLTSGAVRTAALLLALFAGFTEVQSQSSAPAHQKVSSTPIAGAPDASEADTAATQEQLLKLLRTSPTLTMVVARDPSLLSDQDYVSRNNPELARFLQLHPEVARNPNFYLFSNLPRRGGRLDEQLERRIWPDLGPQPRSEAPPALAWFSSEIGPFVVLLCVIASLLWLIRMLLENRRWGRIFKLQTEVHGKLIDRFAGSQELLAYMGTEAGKRFLEAAPIPVDFEREAQVPNAVARVLTPLQIGVVLVLLGIGLLFLRHSVADLAAPLLVLGIVALMPGLGFIISAGITWLLAQRLGLIPENPSASYKAGSGPDERARP